MENDKVLVSFVCQRCSVPLEMDDSLNVSNEHISAELNIPIHTTPDIDLESDAFGFDHYSAPFRVGTDSSNGANNGFMLISDDNDTDKLSHQYKIKTELFDTLSGNSNIDHPLCDECADYLIEILEQELCDTDADYSDYMNCFKILQTEENCNPPKLNCIEHELAELEQDEVRLLNELKALRAQEAELQSVIDEQRRELRCFAVSERNYWCDYVRHRRDYLMADEELRTLECQTRYDQLQLEKLKKTNVFNATFHIWHRGHFGTINNFCLGRLPSAPIDWTEINAAWGQTALLLAALARKISLVFERYRVVPFGNHSYIQVLADNKEYPLYGSGGFRFLWDTKFDNGMSAFLDCLQQFQDRVEKLEKGNKMFCFPYRTNKGKIEDKDASYSIKIQLNSEEQWTKAMKFMLTNLKWGLAWISSQLGVDNDEHATPEAGRC